MNSISDFVSRIQEERAPQLWNMYAQTNEDLDTTGATYQRKRNLIDYLESRVGAHYALVGLAPGYAGARFSGEPFNDEAHVFAKTGFRYSQRIRPWQEETSAVVQSSLDRLGIREDVVAWNALPFHPYEVKAPLTNRTPTWSEIRDHGLPWLAEFLELLKPGIVIPVGRIAERAVQVATVTVPVPRAKYVRHPSHGGAALFFRGLLTIVDGNGLVGAEEDQPGEAGG